MQKSLPASFVGMFVLSAPLLAYAQDSACYGTAQPQTPAMLQAFKATTLPHTYLPASYTYGTNGKNPPEFDHASAFSKQFAKPLQQIAAVYLWQAQSEPGSKPLGSFTKYIAQSGVGIAEYDLLPLIKFSTPAGKTGIVMRALSYNAESTEQTWVAILCENGSVQKVTNIEPGSERSDITNYTYTVKAVINADLTVDYWRHRMKGGAEAGQKGKPYDKGRLDLLQ